MTTTTYNYGWLMPDPGGSANTWGNILNGTAQAIDAKLWSINTQITANNLNISRGPDNGSFGVISFLNYGSTQVRWQLGEYSEPEGAGNTGTNFFLNAYNNSGAYLGNVFVVNRASQIVTFSKEVSVQSGGIAVVGNSSITGSLGVSNGFAVTGGNVSVTGSLSVGSGFFVTGNSSVTGSLSVSNGLSVTGGNASITGGLSVGGNANITGGLSANGLVSISGGVLTQAQAGGDAIFEMTNSSGVNMGYLGWLHTDNSVLLKNQNGGGQVWITSDGLTHVNNTLEVSGDVWTYNGSFYNQALSGSNSNFWFVRNDGVNMAVVYYTMASTTLTMQNIIGGGAALIDGVANFKVNGNAMKPGGGAWLDSSDARVKTVTGVYSSGLNQVAKLNPVRFTYKGNDGDAHALVKGREFVGLVADDAMQAMPELVTVSDGEIDGRKVNDLKMLDPTALIYALVNAVKELKAEIEGLKAVR